MHVPTNRCYEWRHENLSWRCEIPFPPKTPSVLCPLDSPFPRVLDGAYSCITSDMNVDPFRFRLISFWAQDCKYFRSYDQSKIFDTSFSQLNLEYSMERRLWE